MGGYHLGFELFCSIHLNKDPVINCIINLNGQSLILSQSQKDPSFPFTMFHSCVIDSEFQNEIIELEKT